MEPLNVRGNTSLVDKQPGSDATFVEALVYHAHDDKRTGLIIASAFLNVLLATSVKRKLRQIRNRTDISQQMLEMLVCDNGMGIPVEHRERVFDRFPCVDTRLTREVYGLMLGLIMCKRVAQMHGV